MDGSDVKADSLQGSVAEKSKVSTDTAYSSRVDGWSKATNKAMKKVYRIPAGMS